MAYKNIEDARANNKLWRDNNKERVKLNNKRNYLNRKKIGKSTYSSPLILNNINEYKVWLGMRSRCNNKNHSKFKHYGGLGVTVCSRWDSFENFLADMGKRPVGLTIDRINPFKGYCPENCKWATWLEQRHNRRKKNT